MSKINILQIAVVSIPVVLLSIAITLFGVWEDRALLVVPLLILTYLTAAVRMIHSIRRAFERKSFPIFQRLRAEFL